MTLGQAIKISIHAPARGATLCKSAANTPSDYFNPRTREGCDDIIAFEKADPVDFNPRTREGCDDLFPRGIHLSR